MSGNDLHRRPLLMSPSIGILLWGLFFITPCFTTNLLNYWVAFDFMALAVALFSAAWMFIHHKPSSTPSYAALCWLLLLVIPSLYQLLFLNSPNPWAIVKSLIYFSSVYLIFRMSQTSASKQLNNIHWLSLLAYVGNIYALIAILQAFHIFPTIDHSLFTMFNYSGDFSGPLPQRNLTTLLMLIVIASLWTCSIRNHFQKKWLFATLLPCFVVFISNSRSGILLLFLLTVVLFVFSPRKKSYLSYILPLLVASLALSFLANYLLQYIHIPTTDIGSRLAEAGIAARITLWMSSIHLFIQHPWTGIGFGNLISYYADAQGYILQQNPGGFAFNGSTYWSHNVIIQFFAEGGIFGGVFILGLFAAVGQRVWHIMQQSEAIQHPSFSSAIIVSLILIHGLVSISIFQGFFLTLLGLYLAGLFPLLASTASTISFRPKQCLFFVPAFFCAFTFYQFMHIQIEVRNVFDDNPDTPRFINAVSQAINNPWVARSGLEYLFLNMDITHAPNYQWVNLYPFLYEYWLLNQDSLALRRLILQAHLADNQLSEQSLAKHYERDFPHDPWNKKLSEHIQGGHQHHEPLDMQ